MKGKYHYVVVKDLPGNRREFLENLQGEFTAILEDAHRFKMLADAKQWARKTRGVYRAVPKRPHK